MQRGIGRAVNVHEYYCVQGFPGSSVGKESACSAGHLGSIPGLEDPLEKEMATHSSILAWKILLTRGLEGYSPWDGKGPTRLRTTPPSQLICPMVTVKSLYAKH